tara:strand:+ start:418 stop:1179 length:762 start_codon:yes stop_codon:yes gene_type:complete
VNNLKNITLSIFIPCLNEEKNITNTLNNIKEAVQNINYEILVADDSSKDKTIEMVEKYKNSNPDLDIKIFKNERHKGLGFNYFATAHKASGKHYMNLSGDAVDPIQSIRTMVSNIGKADIVTCHHDFNCRSIFFKSKDKQNFTRRLISRLFVITINLITFNNMKYYNGPTIHLLENVKLYKRGVAGMGYQAELITYLLTLNKTYKEVLVETIERKSGTSKAVTLDNIINVCRSVMVIFLNQMVYIIKKVTKRN